MPYLLVIHTMYIVFSCKEYLAIIYDTSILSNLALSREAYLASPREAIITVSLVAFKIVYIREKRHLQGFNISGVALIFLQS